MYGKCGNLQEARRLFDRGGARRSSGLWNTMISCYSQAGFVREALDLLHAMEQDGTIPTAVTYIAALSACSHMGLVELGTHHFTAMSESYGIAPAAEHYACMIDLLSRAGILESAEEFVERMPVAPDGIAWTALLGACKSHGGVDAAERVAERALQKGGQWASSYILLSNLQACS
ncbi:hypothetical protein SELMODRAFT_132894 [Selaginella moellendorffii]|uniref:Pentacotripeptide-repeat region of PRORP domain-containing protein n=3 Tax=Selaginella moellendorffii TaxID=88036 RepID=D8T661_SELML|nr:hypothetical protein SELMODRAFT_132894 [Selaginella moellendorffii]